jgi:hypothetical protein
MIIVARCGCELAALFAESSAPTAWAVLVCAALLAAVLLPSCIAAAAAIALFLPALPVAAWLVVGACRQRAASTTCQGLQCMACFRTSRIVIIREAMSWAARGSCFGASRLSETLVMSVHLWRAHLSLSCVCGMCRARAGQKPCFHTA